jgi:hypothetical protein
MSDGQIQGEARMAQGATPDFEIGLALAGAISAGAYTAGVIDFLFQAFEEWEKARGRDAATVPGHRVGLQVIAGASAGAITGALGAVALARGMQPTPFTQQEVQNSHRSPDVSYQTIRCLFPSLYDTWVTYPRMVDPNGGIDFLSGEDLKQTGDGANAPVSSLLNAKLLDEIKKRALLPGEGKPTRIPPYPYVAEKLHVYMTVSNLRGIPYTVAFGNSTYGMQTHGDRVHYVVSGIGDWAKVQSPWVLRDKNVPLSIATLAQVGAAEVPIEWDQYGTVALASSAFPVGLAPRMIATPLEQYFDRTYPMQIAGTFKINPRFPDTWRPPEFAFLNVDGGLINNNPFDYAQYALMGDETAQRPGGADSDSAVIMVAPFPEPPAFLPDGQPVPELVNVVRALFPALINQARFKATELAPALDPDDHSRFLIAPHRKLPGDSKEQPYTIACGLLGGFGGFLDEKFRAHDFQLGRRNCQAFLRGAFGVPDGNPIGAAMKKMPGSGRFHIDADAETTQPEKYTVIPLVGDADSEVPLPFWLRMTERDFDTLMTRIKGRLDLVARPLVAAQTQRRLLRVIAYVGLLVGQSRVLDYVRLAVLSDLVRRDQIEGWALPPTIASSLQQNWPDQNDNDIRTVLAELANPAYDYRTVLGLALKTHLRPEFVTALLDRLQQVAADRPFLVWQAGTSEGRQLFTLASRKPKGFGGWFWSLPGARQFGNWLQAPSIG